MILYWSLLLLHRSIYTYRWFKKMEYENKLLFLHFVRICSLFILLFARLIAVQIQSYQRHKMAMQSIYLFFVTSSISGSDPKEKHNNDNNDNQEKNKSRYHKPKPMEKKWTDNIMKRKYIYKSCTDPIEIGRKRWCISILYRKCCDSMRLANHGK